MLFILVFIHCCVLSLGDRTKLFSEHGFLLRDHGSVYLDTNDAYISVFLNLALPHFELEQVPSKCNRLFSCGDSGSKDTDCEKQEWTQAQKGTQEALDMAKEKVGKLNKLGKVKQWYLSKKVEVIEVEAVEEEVELCALEEAGGSSPVVCLP